MDKAPSPSSLRDQDRVAPTGQMPIKRDNFGDRDQPLSPGDERIFSANSSTDAAIHGPSRDASERPQSFGGDLTIVPPFNAYASHEQSLVYRGFGNNSSTWDGYPQYFSAADGLHLSPVIYNDNPSLLYHPHYGFNPEVAYGQYSPVATPMPSIMFEGQMYTPHQIPFSPSMYPQPGAQNISSSVPLSPTELMAAEGTGESMFFGPGSGYLMHYGAYGGGNVAGNTAGSSPITTPGAYPQPMGILGPYEHHVGQQRQSHEYGVTSNSSAGHHQRGSFSGTPVSYSDGNDGIRLALEKGRRRDRDQDSVYSSGDYPGFDRNRGPRASKPKGKGTSGQSSPGNDKDNSSSSDIQFELYNRTDFPSDYKQAKFFIIKSFSEDNVHKSIKYNVWASTPHGNKKLDTAYHELKEIDVNCPIFFFFSVNASGQFCGVAEMVGPVDFEKNADHWQQDRWSGQFPVQWHIIKDVPNSRFRHILLENNDNKPVTHSRDCQEVKLWQGIEMLKIFKDHDAYTSILDDFNFYDLRERASKDRKLKQQAGSRIDGPGFLVNETINQMSGSFAQALRLNDSSKELAASKPVVISKPASVVPSNDQNAAISISNNESTILVSRAEDSSNNTISLSRPFDPEEENKVLAAEKISGHPD